MSFLVVVPYLGTAEEDVLLAEWFVDEGESFKRGDSLAVVETLKASFEVEAEEDGVLLRQLVAQGTRVALQAPLGVAGAAGEEVDEAAIAALVERVAPDTAAEPVEEADPAPAVFAGSPGGAVVAAPAARRRAAELGVDLARVRGTGKGGLVRIEDVELAHAGGGASAPGDGALDPAFVAHLRREGAAFAALSSELKVDLYRRHGALVGEGTHIGAGAIVIAERLVLGRGSSIGADCSVEAVELVTGDLFRLGARCRVRTRRIVAGDNAFFAEDVEVGGGGAMDPEAELRVGSHGFVGEHVHLNTCRPLVIGDEVVISRSAVVMTHSFGGSVLAGYPNRFAGVTLGDGCQVGIHGVLFPGVEMGAGSILLSGSSLVSSVPPGRLYGGVPAQDLKAAARPVTPGDLVVLAREQIVEFARQLSLRGREVSLEEDGDAVAITVTAGGARHLLRFAQDLAGDPAETPAEDVRVCCRCADDVWEGLPADVVAVDLSVPRVRGAQGPLADALREFLRKRGVRLHPRTWTYRGGWL